MLKPESNIAHFKIIRKIGEGGMGEVYLAEDLNLKRNVALKILRQDYFDNVEHLNRFNREAKTAAQINHPNIMSIFDMGEVESADFGGKISYIVMEYIDGNSLGEHVSEAIPGKPQLLRIAEKISSGLSAAHKLNIVHRDIKIDNIMVDDDGEPKILDFGLAKPVEGVFSGNAADDDDTDTVSQELTQEGKIVGTITYMSPEQARGEAVDHRSDIFSFGIVLYRIFAGDFPFKGGDRVSTIAKILESKHAPLRQNDGSIPVELDRIIDKCLQKNPDDRYQDTRDLVVDLRNLRRQVDSGISETISSAAYDRPVEKKTGLLKSYILGAAVIVMALIIWFFGDNFRTDSKPLTLEDHENALAIFGFENKTGDESLDWLQSGLPEILLTDLAQNGSINVISRNRVIDCLDESDLTQAGLPNHSACIKAARSLGALTAISGSFYKMGDKIRIDARLENLESGQIIFGEKVIGEEPFALVDSLTKKIAQSLNFHEMATADKNVSQMTTESAEAYKEYTLGIEKMSSSQYTLALDHFDKAIELDSSFALAYLKVGVMHGFANKGQLAIPYFAKALDLKDKLTPRDRSMLDIYSDVWKETNFDDAYSKLKSFVMNNPDDKEGRTLYAVFMDLFSKETDQALKLLDTVLMLDDTYHLALQQLIQIHVRENNLDTAIYYAKRVKAAYPKAPLGYSYLINFNIRSSNYDKAEEIAQELLEALPDDGSANLSLYRINIFRGNIAGARTCNEKIKDILDDDHYRLLNYYNRGANLDMWEGKFSSAFNKLHQGLKEAFLTGDSSRITGVYSSMSDYFQYCGFYDSSVYYSGEGYNWATGFQYFDYPISLVTVDPKNELIARPIFDTCLSNFKSKVPSDWWGIADNLQNTFNALVDSDTLALIELYSEMEEKYNQESSLQKYLIGHYLIETGKYDEGISYLNKIITGENRTTNAIHYMRALYYIGVANEALDNPQEAIRNYQEVLGYWSNPDLEIKELIDLKKRLRNLTS